MVEQIHRHFMQQNMLADLSTVSHQTCSPNGKMYVHFDGLIKHLARQNFFSGGQVSSCDALFFNFQQKTIAFVEFKRLDLFESPEEKNNFYKKFRQTIHLKMSESLLVLAYYLKTHLNMSYDDFFALKKSFFLVYRHENAIEHTHEYLKSKVVINRNKHLFNRVESFDQDFFQQDFLPSAD